MSCGTNCCTDEEFAGRNFLTTEEKVQKLEKYKDWLELESKGVEETIAKLKKAK